VALAETHISLEERLAAHIGLHSNKLWDWDAFPASRGYPELARAQMRYVGAGGSPKVGDTSTLQPSCFTCSLIYLDPHRYAAVHAHEIEEVFFVHQGRLVVSWEYAPAEFVDVMLGPGDMLLNPPDVPHGFRNDGPEPVVAQFMVGHPRPLNPAYKYHPNKGDPPPEFGRPLLPPSNPHVEWIRGYVARSTDVQTQWIDLGNARRLAHQPYVLPRKLGGVVEPGHYSLEMLYLPESVATNWYQFDFEVAFMVWEGVMTVEWAAEQNEARAAARLAKRDLVQVPPGQAFRLANEGVGSLRAAAMIGTADPSMELWTSGRNG
jgi:mannose-6-phosphate isomerase-like protein (cupin superfamily)